MADGKLALDWGMAETLAYATLLADGYAVRLSGQDCGRGTFVHRHAVLHDQNREKWDSGTYMPLQHVATDQDDFVVIDSVLSEEGVLGFEYGYATSDPNATGDLGGAVRRLRQRRAGRHRPVHRLRRSEVGPHVRTGAAAAARLRGPGPGALLRAASSASCSCAPSTTCRSACRPRRRRCSTCCAGRWSAPYRKPLVVMTPEEPAAAQGGGVAAGGVRRRRFPDGDRRRPRRSIARNVQARRSSAAARCTTSCSPIAASTGSPTSRSCASSSCIRSRTTSSRRSWRQLPQRQGDRLVPGRAAEPGRLVPAPRLLPRRRAAEAVDRLRRTARVRLAGGRLHVEARCPAEATDRGGLRAQAVRRRDARRNLIKESAIMRVEVKVPPAVRIGGRSHARELAQEARRGGQAR